MALKAPDVDVVRGVVLGDLDPAVCPQILVEWKQAPFRDEIVIGLLVTRPDGSVVRASEVFSTKTLNNFAGDPTTTILDGYFGLARKMSFQFFELDPRIGIPLTTNAMVPFPSSPLFDPPYIVESYAHYLCKPASRFTQEDREVAGTLKTCSFCESPIYPFGGSRKPGVWCGGNVGFAHTDCAPWVTLKEDH